MLYFMFEFIGCIKSYWKTTYKQELQKQRGKVTRNDGKSSSSSFLSGSGDSCGGDD